MLTPDGARAIADDLGARAVAIRVSDGQNDSTAQVTSVYAAEVDGGVELHIEAEFDSEAANFEWRRRDLLDENGAVLDTVTEDRGRKAAGAIWTAEAVIEIPASAP